MSPRARDPERPLPVTSASPSHLESARGDVELPWRGERLSLYAHTVPRALYTTASIDVLLDGRLLLATGGQPKATGATSARFTHGGVEHELSLTWDRAVGGGFPITLRVDGELVGAATVPVRGAWKLLVVPLLLVLLGVLVALLQVELR